MKTLKEYLFENKKTYAFNIKIAGSLPDKFQERLKEKLDRCNIVVFEKRKATPIQKSPLDFPNLSNLEVTIYYVVCEYPITAPEIASDLKDLGIAESNLIVRGTAEPDAYEQAFANEEPRETALLDDPNYSSETAIDNDAMHGEKFISNFLKDLQDAANERKKELGHDQGGADVLGTHPKEKLDKVAVKSPVGSK